MERVLSVELGYTDGLPAAAGQRTRSLLLLTMPLTGDGRLPVILHLRETGVSFPFSILLQ